MYTSSGTTAGQYRQQASTPHANGFRNDQSARLRKRERPPNVGSKLFSDNENATFFSLLGYDCYSLAAGVVQLLKADVHNPRMWTKHFCGVISLVKDYGKRAYFLRLYDVFRKEFKWQQMLYKNFRAFPTTCPNLLTFESDEFVFGLNFSSREEADNFRTHLDRRYQQEQKTQQKTKSYEVGEVRRARVLPSSGAPARPAPANMAQPMATKTGITTMGTTPTVGGPSLMNLASASRSKKKSGKKEKKAKIRKEDISNPTNFQHKAHIGWDANGGFSQETYDSDPMDNSVRDLLKAAGENPDRMTKEELDFTYRFLDQYSKAPQMPAPPVVQHQQPQKPSYMQAAVSAPTPTPAQAPPPPLRREASITTKPPQKVAPQRPPPSTSRPPARPLPQPPATTQAAAGGAPYRPSNVPPPPPPPPPVAVLKGEMDMPSVSAPAPMAAPVPSMAAAAPTVAPPMLPAVSAAAPPPPPPPVFDAAASPAPAAGRGNLLSEIQAGKALKSVGQVTKREENNNAAGGSRDDVMAQIRQGASLKPVDRTVIESRKSVTPLEDVGGIAGALARALEERRKNMRDSEDSEEEDEEANDSEWETD